MNKKANHAKAYRRTRSVHLTAIAISALSVAYFCAFMLPISKSFPFTDDWTYVAIGGSGLSNVLRWTLLPHNEHFIPLMKLVQYRFLQLSDFDFRALIALNVLVAVVATFAAMDLALTYRGDARWGDLIAPMIFLNIGFGLFGWGFSGQFSMAVAGLLVFLAFFCRAIATDSRTMLSLSLLPLVGTALMGVNGIVISLTMASSLSICAWFAPKTRTTRSVLWAGPSTTFLLLVLFFLTRVPQTTPDAALNFDLLADWAVNMLKSSFNLTAMGPAQGWRAALVGGLVVGALSIAMIAARQGARARVLHLGDTAIHAAIVAHLVLAGSIIVGRSGMGGWSPGLEMHYGYLLSPMPFLAWVVVSRAVPRRAGFLLGLFLAVLYADAARSGANWRMEYLNGTAINFDEIARALRSDMGPSDITSQHMKELFWIDSPAWRSDIEAKIVHYRSIIRRRP